MTGNGRPCRTPGRRTACYCALRAAFHAIATIAGGTRAAGHATQARNIPFGSLEGSRALPSNKAVPLLLMCPTGARAQRAVATLRKLGYEKATAVMGGLNAWREAQLPVEKSAA